MYKKSIFIVVLTLSLFFIFSTVASAQLTHEDPFRAVWDAITRLQKIVVKLQDQIDHIESIPRHGPHVIDANGQDLGSLVDTNTTIKYNPDGTNGVLQWYKTIVSVENKKLLLNILETGVVHAVNEQAPQTVKIANSFPLLYFNSSDCTGDAYVLGGINQYSLIQSSFGLHKNYIIGELIASSTITSHSHGIDECITSTLILPTVFSVQEIALPITEPIMWPLKIIES